MAVVLGPNQYGKAEVRLVHVERSTPRHEITDLTVTTQLRGDFSGTHLHGDNSAVLPTDTQKNTVYAFARQFGIGSAEDFAIRLGRWFVDSQDAVTGARIEVESHAWQRIPVDGREHDHAFSRSGGETRTAVVTVDGDEVWVVSGLRDLVLLKSTGSEFSGFPRDRFTTLPETDDRVLATAVTARWRYGQAGGPGGDLDAAYDAIRATLVQTFASLHSLALQQTLYAMGAAVLEQHAEVAEVRLSLPNRHHLLVDLSPFDLDNPGSVFVAADRPYGLIEGSVLREDAAPAGRAWESVPGFV